MAPSLLGVSLVQLAFSSSTVFVVDEFSDDQDGRNAHATGQVFLNTMIDPEWEDDSIIARMTRE